MRTITEINKIFENKVLLITSLRILRTRLSWYLKTLELESERALKIANVIEAIDKDIYKHNQ